jgi:hypothetical protein
MTKAKTGSTDDVFAKTAEKIKQLKAAIENGQFDKVRALLNEFFNDPKPIWAQFKNDPEIRVAIAEAGFIALSNLLTAATGTDKPTPQNAKDIKFVKELSLKILLELKPLLPTNQEAKNTIKEFLGLYIEAEFAKKRWPSNVAERLKIELQTINEATSKISDKIEDLVKDKIKERIEAAIIGNVSAQNLIAVLNVVDNYVRNNKDKIGATTAVDGFKTVFEKLAQDNPEIALEYATKRLGPFAALRMPDAIKSFLLTQKSSLPAVIAERKEAEASARKEAAAAKANAGRRGLLGALRDMKGAQPTLT